MQDELDLSAGGADESDEDFTRSNQVNQQQIMDTQDADDLINDEMDY